MGEEERERKEEEKDETGDEYLRIREHTALQGPLTFNLH